MPCDLKPQENAYIVVPASNREVVRLWRESKGGDRIWRWVGDLDVFVRGCGSGAGRRGEERHCVLRGLTVYELMVEDKTPMTLVTLV